MSKTDELSPALEKIDVPSAQSAEVERAELVERLGKSVAVSGALGVLARPGRRGGAGVTQPNLPACNGEIEPRLDIAMPRKPLAALARNTAPPVRPATAGSPGSHRVSQLAQDAPAADAPASVVVEAPVAPGEPRKRHVLLGIVVFMAVGLLFALVGSSQGPEVSASNPERVAIAGGTASGAAALPVTAIATATAEPPVVTGGVTSVEPERSVSAVRSSAAKTSAATTSAKSSASVDAATPLTSRPHHLPTATTTATSSTDLFPD